MINKWNLKVAEFVSKESSRYAINAIQVTPDATIATDGHRLTWVSTPKNANVSDFPTKDMPEGMTDSYAPFLLPGDAAKTIAKAIPNDAGSRRLPILANVAIAETRTEHVDSTKNTVSHALVVTDLENAQVFRPREGEGRFPDVDLVFPKDAPVFQISVNASYLAQSAKFAAEFTGKNGRHTPHALLLSFWDNQSPMRLDALNPDTEQAVTMLIMPLKGEPDVRGSHGYAEREAKREAARAAAVDVDNANAVADTEDSSESVPSAHSRA